MKSIFELIWQKALPYQDKRNDEGHAQIVTDYSLELVKLCDGDEDIIVPAAILHDIGWGQLPEEQRLIIWNKNATFEEKRKARFAHQEEGVKLARKILEETNYPLGKIEEILEIISQHDTRQGFISKNEGLMRDADKLSRFTQNEFETAKRNINKNPKEMILGLSEDIDKEGFFYSEIAKGIARRELEQRKKETRDL